MTLQNIALTTLDGTPTSLADYSDRAVLVVNVASKCGLTPGPWSTDSGRARNPTHPT